MDIIAPEMANAIIPTNSVISKNRFAACIIPLCFKDRRSACLNF